MFLSKYTDSPLIASLSSPMQSVSWEDGTNPKLNVPGRKAEVGVWVTHLQILYSYLQTLVALLSLFSSLSGISIILLFSPFTAIFLWSLALYSYHGLPPFIVAGCQLLEASRLTPVYLASSYRAHVHSHQESFKVAFGIVIAINCCCKVQGSKTGNNKWTLRLLCYFSQR